MNLQEAINHARQVYESYRNTAPECDCAMEHLQLENWLKELQSARKTLGLLRSALDETSACADCTLNDRIKQMLNGGNPDGLNTDTVLVRPDYLSIRTKSKSKRYINAIAERILGKPYSIEITFNDGIVKVERNA